MRRLVLFLLLVCLPLSLAQAEDTTVIAAFGDSLFAGFGLEPQDSFPQQLERKLKADGRNVNIINFGVSGDTSAGGVSRIDRVLMQSPDLILLELGANDMLRGMPPQDTRANLDHILASIHAAKIKVLVIGEKAPPSYGKQYTSAYNPLFCELASHYDAPCYPFFLKAVFGHPERMQDDGMHPNPEGVKAIVEDIYPDITKLMKK